MFKDKQQAFRVARQAAAAKEFALMKFNRRFKRSKSEKQAYKPGTTVLSLSAVSLSCKKDWGGVLERSARRYYAKHYREPFKVYYNGDGPVRVPHNIKPSRYAGTRRAGRG